MHYSKFLESEKERIKLQLEINQLKDQMNHMHRVQQLSISRASQAKGSSPVPHKSSQSYSNYN